ncbi:MAG TPA: hypothetical protein VNZ46_27940, partial [Pedobacter sp.]|nr:hypothetical protein [Pedobacter sp.]
RYFLDNVANKIWFIEDRDIKEYPGTYAEYEEWNAKRPPAAATSIPYKQEKEVKPKVEEKKAAAPNVQQQLKKLNDQLQKAETEIAVLEKNVKNIEEELASDQVYGDPVKLAAANKKYLDAKHLLDTAQNTWEDLASEIMEMEGK